jgi:hypothetical protein
VTRTLHALLCAAALVGPASCKDNPPTPTPTAASAETETTSAKLAHCPSAVDGTTTTIVDVPGGVELTVTGTSDDTAKDVRSRAHALVDAVKNEPATIKHNGKGEGGGTYGRCPVVMRDTTVDVADVDKGVKLTVVAKDAAQLDWLRRESRERYDIDIARFRRRGER